MPRIDGLIQAYLLSDSDREKVRAVVGIMKFTQDKNGNADPYMKSILNERLSFYTEPMLAETEPLLELLEFAKGSDEHVTGNASNPSESGRPNTQPQQDQ